MGGELDGAFSSSPHTLYVILRISLYDSTLVNMHLPHLSVLRPRRCRDWRDFVHLLVPLPSLFLTAPHRLKRASSSNQRRPNKLPYPSLTLPSSQSPPTSPNALISRRSLNVAVAAGDLGGPSTVLQGEHRRGSGETDGRNSSLAAVTSATSRFGHDVSDPLLALSEWRLATSLLSRSARAWSPISARTHRSHLIFNFGTDQDVSLLALLLPASSNPDSPTLPWCPTSSATLPSARSSTGPPKAASSPTPKNNPATSRPSTSLHDTMTSTTTIATAGDRTTARHSLAVKRGRGRSGRTTLRRSRTTSGLMRGGRGSRRAMRRRRSDGGGTRRRIWEMKSGRRGRRRGSRSTRVRRTRGGRMLRGYTRSTSTSCSSRRVTRPTRCAFSSNSSPFRR